MKTVSRLSALAILLLLTLLATHPARAASDAKVDLNNASQKELQTLPGVGQATAKKIIAGRPYASVDDLAKAGVSANTIGKIKPLVTVGVAAAAPAAAPAGSPKKTSTKTKASPAAAASAAPPTTPSATTATPAASPKASPKSTKAAPAGPVDLNTASEKELESLPGVGPATAKKILAGRPYATVDDLAKAGVAASTIAKLKPNATVSAAAPAAVAPPTQAAPVTASAPPAAAAAPSAAAAPAASAKPAATQSGTSPATIEARTPPAPGMVWVNTASKVYHKAGDRWYGKTKEGKFMTELDAIAAGYRAAKMPGEKSSPPGR